MLILIMLLSAQLRLSATTLMLDLSILYMVEDYYIPLGILQKAMDVVRLIRHIHHSIHQHDQI